MPDQKLKYPLHPRGSELGAADWTGDERRSAPRVNKTTLVHISSPEEWGLQVNMAIGRSISARKYLLHSEIREMAAFEKEIAAAHPEVAANTIACLGRYYGTTHGKVLALAEADPRLAAPLNADGEILAQVVHAVRSEMAHTLLDIVLRRTGIATLGHPGRAVLEQVAAVVAAELGWDQRRRLEELEVAEIFLRVPGMVTA